MAEKQQMYRVIDKDKDLKYDDLIKSEQKDPELREYLVCIKATPGSGENDVWDIVHGRTEAYELVKECIQYTDFQSSFVLVESCRLYERVSIYQFMKKMSEFFDDNFDVDDYIKGDWSEHDFMNDSVGIDTDFANMINSSRQFNQEDMMNGAYDIHDINNK